MYSNINGTGIISLSNCLVAGNAAAYYGGGGYNVSGGSGGGSLSVTGCTVTGNLAAYGGGGFYNNNYKNAAITLTNDIVYGDVTTYTWGDSGEMTVGSGSAPVASYCDIGGGYAGVGNLATDPLFVSAGTDFHLQPGSPCLGAGTSRGTPTTTLDGFARPAVPSIGAYEAAATALPAPAATATTLTTSGSPSVFSQSVTVTATVAGTGGMPTGTVTFTVDGTAQAPVVVNGNGTAAYRVSALSVGLHHVTAAYSGDTSFAPSASATLTQTVNPIGTTTTLVSSVNPSASGQSVTVTATVAGTGGTPTGTVTFTVDGVNVSTPVSLSSGVATYAANLSVGTHIVTAAYSGDAAFAASASAALTQMVNKITTTTVLISSLNPATIGQPVRLAATVTGGGPTGTVTFTDTTLGVTLGTGTLSGGSAALTASGLAVGGHQITVSYGGDVNNLPSASAALTQTVSPIGTTVALASSVNPSVSGQSVTVTATVIGAVGLPTGTVTFTVDGTAQGPTAITGNGTASYSASSLAVGAHRITAAYSGDTSFASSASAMLTQTVSPAGTTTTLASSVNPSASGQSVTLTATVTGGQTLTGTVQFRVDGISVGSPVSLSGGAASYSCAGLSVGTHTVTATYSGDNSGLGSAATLTLTVQAPAPVPMTHLLWTNADGSVSLWNDNAADGSFTQTTYGPYTHWSVKAIADGGTDGKTRVLWDNTDGTASIWSLDTATGSFTQFSFGPYKNWTATAVSVGKDNTTHVLWTSTNGTAAIWNYSVTTGTFTQNTYGPYAGWSAKAIADGGTDGKTRVLWTNTDGTASLWSLDTATGSFTQNTFGPYSGWSARALSVGKDNLTHVLWTNPDGTASLWNYNTATGGFTQNTYGPYAGWTAKAIADGGTDGKTRVLWGHPDGHASLWSLDTTTGLFTQNTYGSYAGWTATAISAP